MKPGLMYACGTIKSEAITIIRSNHYSHSIPSGKSHYYVYNGAICCFSIPANKNIGRFLLGSPGEVWELSRLWAPDGHERNLLTRLISDSISLFRKTEPKCQALVSYADPNVGHSGGVYRAASWKYCGVSEESRYYQDSEGQVVSRRKFHSGKRSLRKAEILALGYRELKLPGKHRFAKGLTKSARKAINRRFP